MTGLQPRYRRNDEFVLRRIKNESVLVPIKDNIADMSSMYSLNEVGAFIWQNINCKNSMGEIKNMILSEFETTEEQASTDLNEFVEALQKIEAIGPANGCTDCRCR